MRRPPSTAPQAEAGRGMPRPYAAMHNVRRGDALRRPPSTAAHPETGRGSPSPLRRERGLTWGAILPKYRAPRAPRGKLARRFATRGLPSLRVRPVGFGKAGTEEGAILAHRHEMRTR